MPIYNFIPELFWKLFAPHGLNWLPDWGPSQIQVYITHRWNPFLNLLQIFVVTELIRFALTKGLKTLNNIVLVIDFDYSFSNHLDPPTSLH